MRRLRIILALLILLCMATREARALVLVEVAHKYTVSIAGYEFGFSDGFYDGWGTRTPWGNMHLGPFGNKPVSFTARQGLTFVGLAVGLLMSSMVSALIWFRWRRAKVAPA